MTFALAAALLGWSGTVALLVAYGLVSAGRLSGKGSAFQWLNIYGSGGLGVAAVEGAVWSAVTLNAVWVAIGVITLVKAAHSRARAVGPSQPPGQA